MPRQHLKRTLNKQYIEVIQAPCLSGRDRNVQLVHSIERAAYPAEPEEQNRRSKQY